MQTITLEEAQARLLEVVHCVMSEKVELLRSIDRILQKMCMHMSVSRLLNGRLWMVMLLEVKIYGQ